MAFQSEKEIEGNKKYGYNRLEMPKYESRSHVFRVFLLLGLTKIIILVVVFVYFYSSLMESRENISMLQHRMMSLENLCVQLARHAVESKQQIDYLIEEKLPVPASQLYPGEEDEEPLYDDYALQHLVNAQKTENNNESTVINETTPTSNRNEPTYEEEKKTDDFDADLCDIIDFEEFKRHCKEVYSHHGRVKRSNQRGKNKGRKSPATGRNRSSQRHRNRGPVATHFKGGLPETFIQDSGLVAPWYSDNRSSAEFGLSYEFREGKGKVQVADNGLYLIYAQVYYLTNQSLNSYAINIREQDSETTPVAFCSSNAVVPQNGGITEVSCFTSVVRYLKASTEVFITQRERNRRMILREGYTFLGLVRLNKHPEPKRQRGSRN